ncbi:MAG: PhoH family protein [Planctomycetes bacterium]|nr:PhoH family protein [Planctomycetota bacterium]
MSKVKTFVLDTNVLLHDPNSLHSFQDNNVVLPMAVIEELDSMKTRSDEIGRNARRVIRDLDNLRDRGKLGDGVRIDEGGIIKIISSKTMEVEIGFSDDKADNRIIRVAYGLHKEGKTVTFITKDINARIKADALGLNAMDFEKEKINFDELYTGFREVEVPRETVDQFYAEDSIKVKDLDVNPNEFIVLRDETNPKHTALSKSRARNELVHLSDKLSRAWHIRPKNREQRMALELLLDDRISFITLVGQAGSGKTLLALAAALELTLRAKNYDKILVSRPIMPLGRDIGYLPGNKDAKLASWMQPIFDNLGLLMRWQTLDWSDKSQKKVDALISDNILELEALTYIRGRTINRHFMIIDEAQNLTPHEIKTIVSRAGDGTKIVLTGDPYQIDNPYLDANSNGLTYAAERLKSQSLHGHVTLRKSERSELAALAAEEL